MDMMLYLSAHYRRPLNILKYAAVVWFYWSVSRDSLGAHTLQLSMSQGNLMP